MKMTNKLFLHHKNKFALVMRNLSIAVGSFTFAFAALTIPTYISVVGERNVPTQAEEEKTPVVEEEQEEQTEEEENLLTYEEE